MEDAPVPSLGRIVLVTLSASCAAQINKRRNDARNHIAVHIADAKGVVVHTGNDVAEGDVFPMVITRVWNAAPNGAVNGQILLDGNDTFWACSVTGGDQPGQYRWPTRA